MGRSIRNPLFSMTLFESASQTRSCIHTMPALHCMRSAYPWKSIYIYIYIYVYMYICIYIGLELSASRTKLEPSSYLRASSTTTTTTNSSHRRQRQSRQQARALLQVYKACSTLHDHHGSAVGTVQLPMYWQGAPWEHCYFGPQSYGKHMHRRPNPSARLGRAGQPCRFCPACGTAHNDSRLTTCRNKDCGAPLTPPTPPAPPTGGKGNEQQRIAVQPPRASGANGQKAPTPPVRTIKPLHPNQMPVGGGLNQGELNSLIAIEMQQKRRQELDEQGCWPPTSTTDGEPTALSAEDALAIAKHKNSIAALQSLPEEMQDADLIADLEAKLSKLSGKQPTTIGEQRAAGKLTHLLGKLRTTYAADKEACQRESKAAAAALEAAQLRVAKAAEWESTLDSQFRKREARVQATLDNCTCDPPPTIAVPTVHLPDATIQYSLPPDVLASTLAGVVREVTSENQLATDSLELKIMKCSAPRLSPGRFKTA